LLLHNVSIDIIRISPQGTRRRDDRRDRDLGCDPDLANFRISHKTSFGDDTGNRAGSRWKAEQNLFVAR
jgi:hypothetical protein